MKIEELKLVNNEVGVSKHIPITHLNESTIFELSNGQVGAVLKLKGVPFDTATNEELNQYRRIKHHTICALGEEFSVYEHTVRQKIDINLEGEFKEPFIKEVNEKYQAQFKNRNLYTNDLYMTILYKGIDSGKFGKVLNIFQKMSNKAIKAQRAHYRKQSILSLKKEMQKMMEMLSVFKPHFLGKNDTNTGYSELMTFYGLFPNGLIPTSYSNVGYASPMIKGISNGYEIISMYPQGNLANYLPQMRLFFGDYIEFRRSNNQSRFGAIVSLKEYGTATASIMLDALLRIDCEFILTNSFFMEVSDAAQGKIIKQLIRMENSNDPALSQMEQLKSCRDDLASGRLKVGYHHNTIMLIHDNLEALQKIVNKTIKIFSDVGIMALQETIGLEASFWAQIPGNQKYIARSQLITSQNFIDFCPLHNYRTGYRDGNHLGAAVTLIETPSRTPLFFNYHTQGSGKKNDLTPGHTTIIGGNGSGKTVFMGFMDSQMSRYGGRSFFFDRDRGMEIYIRATQGVYSIISADYPNEAKFNPFCMIDTPKNRSFLKKWMGQLVIKESEDELPADIDRMISDCVDYSYESLSPIHRNLSTVTKLLPIDFSRWDRLKKWLKSDGIHSSGDYAYLFDNEIDSLNLSVSKVGFDFTELMSQPNSVLTSVCMYLVHRINESLDGQRVSIYFDEGWQILDNAYWKHQLKKDLPTFRKNNAHIILATQSPESIVNSSLSAQFLDNCATHIFFCNSNANFEKHYQHFNIKVSEFDFIKNTPRERRLFLYKQSEESAICKLQLSGMENELAVYSANKMTIRLLDQVREEVGNNPEVWLPIFQERRCALQPD